MATSLRVLSTSFGLALLTSLNAQITFGYEDLAVPGDVVERYVDTIPAFGPGGSGAGQIWDLSAAVPDDTVITTVSTPDTTPYASGFAGSNVAMTNNGVDFLYFNSTPAALIATGAAGDFLQDGQELVVPFNPSLFSHQLPRNYGDRFSDTYAFEVVADGAAFGVHSVRLRHSGSVRDTTDAYGQITTPVGTYDALRVKSTDFTTDSIWVRILSFTPWTLIQGTRDTTVAYSWLAKETKLAVAEMSFDSLGDPARFTYSAIPPSISTGLDAREVSMAHIHPVPAQDGFTLSLGSVGTYDRAEVFSPDGRCMAVTSLTHQGSLWFETSDWGSGIYLLRLWSTQGRGPTVLRAVVQ